MPLFWLKEPLWTSFAPEPAVIGSGGLTVTQTSTDTTTTFARYFKLLTFVSVQASVEITIGGAGTLTSLSVNIPLAGLATHRHVATATIVDLADGLTIALTGYFGGSSNLFLFGADGGDIPVVTAHVYNVLYSVSFETAT